MLLPVPPSPPFIGSPSSVSLPQPLLVSHAWLIPSHSSSTTLPPSSPTIPLPTHSRPPTSYKAGIRASPPQLAPHFPASRVTGLAFMSRQATALHFQFSGGVCERCIYLVCAHLYLIDCRKRNPIIWLRCWPRHLRPSARRRLKLIHITSHLGAHLIGII
jgi:hypothetical protein